MSNTITANTDKNGVITITLNRPEFHNSLSTDLISDLCKELQKIKKSSAARVLILAAAGKTFCSGGDLKQLMSSDNQYSLQLEQLMQELYLCPIPTIARVHASSYGGGVGLICSCDYAIATPDSCLALTELKLGLIPATICPYLVAAIGPRHAKQLVLNSEKITSGRAYQLGLFSKITSTEKLDSEITELCNSLLQAGPHAIKQIKKLVNQVIDFENLKKINTAKWLTKSQYSDEAQEGITAFFEKRNPSWVLTQEQKQ